MTLAKATRWVTMRRARMATLVALTIPTVAAAPHRETVPGMTFDLRMSMTAQTPNGPMNSEITARGKATADGSYRVDIVSAGSMPMPFAAGDYMLLTSGRPVIVRPGSKTYVDLVDQTTMMLKSLPPELASQMSFSGISGKVEKLDDASPVAGRPVEHYRSTMSYTMSMMGQALPMTIVSEYWLAKLPVAFANPFGPQANMAIEGPFAAIAQKTREVMPPLDGRVALKTTVVTTTSAMGQSIVNTVTTELLNLKDGDVDASDMQLPQGYTKADK